MTGAPIVADETVVLTSSAGMFGLSLHDGSKRWHRDVTPATFESAMGYGEQLVSPVAADGKVFCPTDDGVIAIDIGDGSLVWRASALTGTGTPATNGDGLVLSTGDGLIMLDANDGSRRWTAATDARLPAIADGMIITGTDRTVALDATTGQRQWTAPRGSYEHPVVTDGVVYLSTGDDLVGRALADGAERWRVNRGRFVRPPVVTPRSVYVVESPGEAGDATFAFDRRSGGEPEPRWCSQVGIGAVTAAAETHLFALLSGSLVAFTTDFGDATWRYPPGDLVQPPAILDGGVITVSTDGVVAAIGGD